MTARAIAACALLMGLSLPFQIEAQPPGGEGAPPAQRERMEQRLRQGLWHAARVRIPLSDDQMRKLELTSARYDGRRRSLAMDERIQRQLLRSEVGAGDSADQGRVAAALDRLLQIQRLRLDIVAEEQRELAGFMTPVERARYGALQDQLRRRMQIMQRRRGGEGMPGPGWPR